MDQSTETRNPGFSTSTKAVTANQLYNSYLQATGDTKKGTKKQAFKDWIAKQKASGNLDKLLQAGKGVAQNVMAQRAGSSAAKEVVVPVSEIPNLPDPAPEKAKFMGMPVPVAIGVGILAIAAITTIAIVLYKKGKSKSAA